MCTACDKFGKLLDEGTLEAHIAIPENITGEDRRNIIDGVYAAIAAGLTGYMLSFAADRLHSRDAQIQAQREGEQSLLLANLVGAAILQEFEGQGLTPAAINDGQYLLVREFEILENACPESPHYGMARKIRDDMELDYVAKELVVPAFTSLQ